MSFIANWWRRNWYGTPPAPIPQVQESQQDQKARTNQVNIGRQVTILTNKIKHLEHQALKKEQLAKKAAQEKKQKQAQTYLAQRNQLRKKIAVEQGKLHNLEETQMTLSSAVANKDMFYAMKDTNHVIQEQLREIDVDEVNDIKDNLKDASEKVQDISDIFSSPIMGEYEYEEDNQDVMAEINQWVQESEIIQSHDVEKILPSTPTRALGDNNNNNSNNDDNTKVIPNLL